MGVWVICLLYVILATSADRSTLNRLCAEFPSASACVLFAECQNSTFLAQRPSCASDHLLANLCSADAGFSHSIKCQVEISGHALNNLIDTLTAFQSISQICQGKPDHSVCSKCSSLSSCERPLRLLGQICSDVPSHKDCLKLVEMCHEFDPEGFSSLCRSRVPLCSSESLNDACLELSRANSFAGSILEAVCLEIPHSVPCLLRRACMSSSDSPLIPMCSSFSFLKLACDSEVSVAFHPFCKNISSICSRNPGLIQCSSKLSLSTSDALHAVQAFCLSSRFTAAECIASDSLSRGNPLEVFSSICRKYRDPSCDRLRLFCSETRGQPSEVCSELAETFTSMQTFRSISNEEKCFKTPADPECSSFSYPNASIQSDLDTLCKSMPNMIGCSLRQRCVTSEISGDVCEGFSILSDICLADLGMSKMPGCSISDLCAPGSMVPQCSKYPPLSNVVGTFKSTQDVIDACKTMSMPGCSECTASSCPDPLGSISRVCLSMNMKQCGDWKKMCSSDSIGSDLTSICGTHPTPSPVPPQPSCVENPLMGNCSHFQYPVEKAATNIAKLCLSMPQMIGCSVYRRCLSGAVLGKYCNEFSIWGDICFVDSMQKMDGCGDYVSMCKAGSLVPQCKTETIPKMITTSKTTLDVINMCSQMDMPGCSSCTSSKCGDPLFSISQVCLSMEMERCLGWTTMCQSIAADGEGGHMSFFCGKDPSHLAAVPLMRMYFHTGYLDYVLFKGWVATSFVQYLFSILAIIFTAMLTVFLKSWRLHSDEETRLASIQKSRESDPLLSDSRIRKRKRLVPFWKHMIPSSIQLRENCRRMIFAFFILILDYCLMLIAMSFNVGYFFAVILGVALGTLLWGHELVFSISDNCCD